MKITIRLIISIISVIALTQLKAQGYGEWTWVKGSNFYNSPGNFGSLGIPSPNNNPPALYEACNWTDLNGNFWIYGGVDGNQSLRNALWKFDPITNEWTWVKQTTGLAVYGTQGIPAPNNGPGGIGFGAVSWVDNSGDLWLFGGSGFDGTGTLGILNDLWRYNIATNQWTWMKGSGSATTSNIFVAGTKGVANMANTPNGRQETNGGVVDGLGNLWLFGGMNNVNNAHNDVWKYNIASNMWTWVSGNQSFGNPTNYGTINVSSPLNNPGDRFCYTKFVDAQNNLYFLGGGLSSYASYSDVIDVWKFNPTTTEWTWVGGNNIVNYAGIYNATCDTVNSNVPLAKFEIRASWSDSCGVFFFGGLTGSFSSEHSYNDLWYYNIETNKFTWISGTNIPDHAGNYGTLGLSATTNLPPARGGAASFKDKQSNLWVFGGQIGVAFGTSFNAANDLWRFKLDPNCGKLCSKSDFKPTANFVANTICGTAPLSVDFINTSVSATSYTWNFGDGSPLNNSVNPSHTYTANGTYTVSLTAQHSGTTTSTIVKNAYIYIGGLPNASFNTLINDTVCLNTPFTFTNTSQDSIVANTWLFGDGLGATTANTFHQYALSGSYTVSLIVKDNHNCLDTTLQKVVVMPIPTASFSNFPQTGCLPLSVGFTNNSSIGSVNFLWKFGDSQTSTLTSPTHTYLTDGTFKVILVAQNTFGCKDSAKGSVIVYPKPNADFTLTGYDGCFPYEVSAFANELGLASYQWSVNGNNVSTNDSISFGTIESTTAKFITLITTTSFGCKDTSSVSKIFTDDNCGSLYIPNVFTPNGDASNNLFAVKALNYKSYHIAIYDRWGLKMFESSDSNSHWNGKKQNTGSDCSDGTYFYIITVIDKKDKQSDYKGFLNLFR